MGCALYEMLGLDCWYGPRCADCPSLGNDEYDDGEPTVGKFSVPESANERLGRELYDSLEDEMPGAGW